MTPYGAPQAPLSVALNVNENTHPVPQHVADDILDAIALALREVNRYPDREFTALREGFADYLGHGLERDQIWAGNGSNEVLQHILQAFGGPGRTAFGFAPTYSMYPLLTRGTGAEWIAGTRGHDFVVTADDAARQVADARPDVVFLCAPNNPTGTPMGLDVIEAVYDATDGIVIVDEAYQEFAPRDERSAVTLLPDRERLVVSRTMSKAFAFAGARVGYLAADPAFIDALRLVRLPYHLSALTQAAATAALRHAPVDAVDGRRDRRAARADLRDGRGPGVSALRVLGELRALRGSGRPGRDLARTLRSRHPDPRHRDPGTPPSDGRHRGGDHRVPRRPRLGRIGLMTRPDTHRTASLRRATSESTVELSLDLDGTGVARIDTTVPFFDHLLTAFAKHSLTDLTVRATGDTQIDAHHTVEDVAIVLGDAIREALGDKSGISRYGDALVPLDEALAQAVVDLSGRPYLVHDGEPAGYEFHLIGGHFTGSLVRHTFEAIAFHAAMTAARARARRAATRTTSPRRSTRRSRARSVRPRRSIRSSRAFRAPRALCDPQASSSRSSTTAPATSTPPSRRSTRREPTRASRATGLSSWTPTASSCPASAPSRRS